MRRESDQRGYERIGSEKEREGERELEKAINKYGNRNVHSNVVCVQLNKAGTLCATEWE